MGELAERLKKLKKAHNTLVEVVEGLEQNVNDVSERINKIEVLTERNDKKSKEIPELREEIGSLMDRVKKASSFVKKQAEEAVFVEVHNQPIKIIEEVVERVAREKIGKLEAQSIKYITEFIPLSEFKVSSIKKKNEQGYRCIGLFGPPAFREEHILFEKAVVEKPKEAKKKIKRTPA